MSRFKKLIDIRAKNCKRDASPKPETKINIQSARKVQKLELKVLNNVTENI